MRASRLVYDGRIVRLSIDTVQFPDGSEGDVEMIRHSGAAAVLPVKDDPGADDPVVVLIRQYRYAAGGDMLEVPAGRPDTPGEDWDACARRELREETGLTAQHMVPLTTIYTTPGFTDERIHVFMATRLTPGAPTLDPDEFVEPVDMPFSHALERIRTGEIIDAKTICTILYASTFLRTR